MAAAPFPAAASLLARGQEPSWIKDRSELRARLDVLPLEVLPLDTRSLSILRDLGLDTVGELLDLPRSGLRKRFGEPLPQLLERALGNIPDPRSPFVPPPRFEARLELPTPVYGSEPLLFAARRLLQELAGGLAARGEAVSTLQFLLHPPYKGEATRLNLNFSKPNRDFHHWLLLLRERLERTSLDHEVEAIVLRGGPQVAQGPASGDLFQKPEQTEEARSSLLDRLQARLGQETVSGLSLVDDHRPERAWRLTQPGEQSRGAVSGRRPLWLLREPLGLSREASSSWQLHGPERIETGWWDGQDAARDYFLAETKRGEKLWVFRDRRNRDWFLHGVFA
jgi:protein ImuB